MSYQSFAQINGSSAHEAVDTGSYSTRKSIITGLEVYSEKYNIVGKIDIYDETSNVLTERKRKINEIYDGYIFQLYAQCVAMREMRYTVSGIRLYSMLDNKVYPIALPEDNPVMLKKFEDTISEIRKFSMEEFKQNNIEKCRNCIYEPACDRGLI